MKVNNNRKFSVRDRFIIGVLALAGVPYETAWKLYCVSKSYYADLKGPASKLLDALFSTRERVTGVILITPEFVRRCVVALTCYCRSPLEGIIEFFDRVIGHHVSKGSVENILKETSKKAEEFDRSVPLESVRDIAVDEIFQQGKPVLTVADMGTHYVVMMEAAKDRTGETWKAALEEKKARGLFAQTCVSDAGTGLLNGVPAAFPEIEMQPDVFHALRDTQRHIRSVERKSFSLFTKLYHLEEKLCNPNAKKKTREQYAELSAQWETELKRTEILDILFSWLREYLGWSGYGYARSLALCQWITDEMSALYPEQEDFLKAVRKFRNHLPALLSFLRRLENKMREASLSFRVDPHAFQLLYNQTAYHYTSEEYRFMDRKLFSVFGERIFEARDTLASLLRSVFRASSLIENVNGRLRAFMDLKREIPEPLFILLKVFFNTKKDRRPRNQDWKGISAVDRLTGQSYPEFLDLLLGQRNYVVYMG